MKTAHIILPALLAFPGGIVTTGGCSPRIPGPNDPIQPQDLQSVPASAEVETFASPLRITAGATTTVQCVIRMDEEHLPEAEALVQVLHVGSGTQTFEHAARGGVDLRLDRAGEYWLRCATPDLVAQDPQGLHVTVVAAAPVAVHTTLSAPTVRAGDHVWATCQAEDAFGNPSPALATGLRASPGVWVERSPTTAGSDGATQFRITGLRAGEQTIGCILGDLEDETPASLTVVPGFVASAETEIDRPTVAPTEVVTVTCTALDAFGNVVPDASAHVVVLDHARRPAVQNGLLIIGNTLRLARAGTYYVFCNVDDAVAGDESPAQLTVHAGLPYAWSADLIDLSCYLQNAPIPLQIDVIDYWGNPILDAPMQIETDPTAGAAITSAGALVISAEGDYEITLSLVGALHPEATAGEHRFHVRVDSTPPILEISHPGRAAMVVGGDEAISEVAVRGRIDDAWSPLERASVGGLPLNIPAGARSTVIALTLPSRWGLSIIHAAAQDECGNRAVLVQSYLRSPVFQATGSEHGSDITDADGTSPPLIDGALLARINPSMLDALADTVQRALSAQSFDGLLAPGSALIPTAAADPQWIEACAACGDCAQCDEDVETVYRLQRHADAERPFSLAGPFVDDLAAVDGGLRFSLRVEDLSLPLQFKVAERHCDCGLPAEDVALQLDATAGAERLRLSGVLAVGREGGPLEVDVETLRLDGEALSVDLECGDLQAICDELAELALDLLHEGIEAVVGQLLADALPPLLTDFLHGFRLPERFDLPPPLDASLGLQTELGIIRFCGPDAGLARPLTCPATSPIPGYGELGLGVLLRPSERSVGIPASALGSIRKSMTPPQWSWFAYDLGVALADDLINQLLWALWYGGVLHVDDVGDWLGGDARELGVELSLRMGLPPVLMPGRGNHEIEIGIGDAHVHARVDLGALLGNSELRGIGLGAELYVSAILAASLRIEGSDRRLHVELDPDPSFYTQVLHIDNPLYQGAMSDFLAEILRLLIPPLLGTALDSFPLPDVDVAALVVGDDAPAWPIRPDRIIRSGTYYRLSGSAAPQNQAPPPMGSAP